MLLVLDQVMFIEFLLDYCRFLELVIVLLEVGVFLNIQNKYGYNSFYYLFVYGGIVGFNFEVFLIYEFIVFFF